LIQEDDSMIELNGNDLSIEQVIRVAYQGEKVRLSKDALDAVESSHSILLDCLQKDVPFYGVNTGYGIFHTKKISKDQLLDLNRNLILSHAVAAGDELDIQIVRAAMLIRANTLAKGFSGIRLSVIQCLLDMLNKEVTPLVCSQGSMGSSGDLCQLAQLALVFTTDKQDLNAQSGYAYYAGKLLSGKDAMQAAHLERMVLEPKEGLALINGATFSAAIGTIVCWYGRQLCDLADAGLAQSMEALLGRKDAFDGRLHAARGLQGQIESAKNVRHALANSEFIDSSIQVQDGYALRCAPQVHGAVRDSLVHAEHILTSEINAATDNPLIFENGDVISGGNFHGEPIALVMDLLGIALAELGAISERRVFRLLDDHLNNGLPLMLISDGKKSGTESGLMIPQYTAASLVMENQHLANSDAVHSLPTSANQEDHNANSLTAARHALMITKNTLRVIAIEMYISAHAMDIRKKQYPDKKMGEGTQVFYEEIRTVVTFQEHDTLWGEEINKLLQHLEIGITNSNL
jgi:histidine ammonia-lyase